MGALLEAVRDALVRAACPFARVSGDDGAATLTWEDEDGEWRVEVDWSSLVDWLERRRLQPGTRAWREHWSDVHIDAMETTAYFGVAGSPYRYEPDRGLVPRPEALGELELDDVTDGTWFALPPNGPRDREQ